MQTPKIMLPESMLDALGQGQRSSPLGRYLASVVDGIELSGKSSVSREATGGLMQAALTMACRYPFSPSETMEIGPRKLKMSLVQAVLHIANDVHPRAKKRTWPATIEQFGSSPPLDSKGQPVALDCEWVAAALVVGGCNPWQATHEVPIEVDRAVGLGMVGLVETLLSLDGAMHPDHVLLGNDKQRSRHLWMLISSADRVGMLDALTRGGVDHWEIDKNMVADLINARPECLAVLVSNGLDIADAKIRDSIAKGWLERVKRGALDPLDCARMQKTAFGKTVQDMDAGSMMVAQTLAVEWGSRANGSSARAYDFMNDTGAKELCTRGNINRGQMAGQWSVLAAAVMSRIRQANPNGWQLGADYKGCLGWSAAGMLQRRWVKSTGQWISPDCSDPSLKGALAHAIGFEWNKGISIDGIMVLGLWGQEDNKEQDQYQRIPEFAYLAGIDDLQAWSQHAAAHAAAFTCSIIKPNTTKAANAMMSTWARALEQCPAMVEGIDERARVDLLHSFTCGFNAAEAWGGGLPRQLFQKLADKMFDGADWSDFLSGSMTAGPQREAALVISLVESMHPTKPVARRGEIIELLRQQLALPEDQGGATLREKGLLRSWARAHGKDGAKKAEADTIVMEIETAQAKPLGGVRGPRF